MTLKIPGKTFLVGEYAVLVGGEALVLTTEPGFEVSINPNGQLIHQFHPQSAAGLLLKDETYPHISIQSLMASQGGYGYSTAEFIAAWTAKNKLGQSQTLNSLRSPKSLQRLFNDYISLYSSSNQNEKPSGADLISMLLGGVTHFKRDVESSVALQWPFHDIDFAIISTGLKVKTHEHLSGLKRQNLVDLIEPSQKVIQSFLNPRSDQFIDNIRAWSLILRRKEMQHNDSWSIKLSFEKIKTILAAKPNGALGADTITILYETCHKNEVHHLIKNQGFSVMATSTSLSQGLKYVD